jgi:hypothetical protein
LLVDDDEDSYLLTRRHLSKISSSALSLDWAPSYEKGLEQIAETRHDVLPARLSPGRTYWHRSAEGSARAWVQSAP